jgi:hypothetical protein
VNRSTNRKSGAFSFKRVNSTSNLPDVLEHGDASTVRTPVHVLSRFRASEMLAFVTVKAGVHICCAAFGVAVKTTTLPASQPARRSERM